MKIIKRDGITASQDALSEDVFCVHNGSWHSKRAREIDDLTVYSFIYQFDYEECFSQGYKRSANRNVKISDASCKESVLFKACSRKGI